MVLYEFRSADGSVIEQRFSMRDVPNTLTVDGVMFVRQRGWGGATRLKGDGWAGKKWGSEIGDPDKGILPDLPIEFGGTLNTARGI